MNTKKTNSTLKQVDFKVSGRVQGVCFRMFVQQNAKINNVSGWVRNCSDGTSVEGLMQGSLENLHKMIEILKKGPSMARVLNSYFDWEENPKQIFDSFDIKH
ncbi:MAG: hypothetical protein ACD_79C00734G0004 [uncultured bacterium]|nr:MAG: hypothetical protein ACD_79C00734G0004 [uncultured bacterium]